MGADLLEAPVEVRRPQPGPQEAFASTSADIAIMGGSVFGGKTWALCFEPLRHISNPGFTFVAFRRLIPELTRPGGMWEETLKMYPHLGGEPTEHKRSWDFPSGATGMLSGLQYESDVEGWKGAQIALLLFDQLEEFTARQFWYLVSRNRSVCGVRPYIRGTCNPDPDSFLATFLAWWIDQDTGYAIPERSGRLRWFIRETASDEILWADSREELAERYGEARARFAKSVTFILARLQDNVIGNTLDPDYEASVRAMPYVEAERLLGGDRGGNWKVRPAAGLVFDRAAFQIVDAAPAVVRGRVRAWDKAATPGGGDYTAGVRMSRGTDGLIYVEDVSLGQWGSGPREAVIKQVAQIDGTATRVFLEQEPGSGGKDSAGSTILNLAGFNVAAATATGDKVTRAGPFAAQVKAGNVRLVRGDWNEVYLRELHAFPTPKVHDDQVDASALAFNQLLLHETTFAPVRVRI